MRLNTREHVHTHTHTVEGVWEKSILMTPPLSLTHSPWPQFFGGELDSVSVSFTSFSFPLDSCQREAICVSGRKVQTLWIMLYELVGWAVPILNGYLRNLENTFSLWAMALFPGFSLSKDAKEVSLMLPNLSMVSFDPFLLLCGKKLHGSVLEVSSYKGA